MNREGKCVYSSTLTGDISSDNEKYGGETEKNREI